MPPNGVKVGDSDGSKNVPPQKNEKKKQAWPGPLLEASSTARQCQTDVEGLASQS
jgi:hypothetical protein